MKSRIYVETSVVSFYHEVRTEPDIIARRDWTRQFWADAKDHYDLFTSVAVLEELQKGEFPNKQEVLNLTLELPLLANTSEVDEVAIFF